MLHSVLDAALAGGVELEKCVITALKTASHQKQALLELVLDKGREELPLEWVIDIADERNGWFIGTAYSWRDATNELYITVPDRFNPTFEGWVRLDHRAVRLVECVDASSRALFNKLLRDSIVKVRWEVEWCEEADNSGDEAQLRQWVAYTAKYYIRLSNQVLLEDHLAQERAFVIVPADQSLRFIRCVREKGSEDYNRLVNDGVVLRPEESKQNGNHQANGSAAEPMPALPSHTDLSQAMSTIADNCRRMSTIVEEYEAERIAFSRLFVKYIMEGNLEDGAKLLKQAEATIARATSNDRPSTKLTRLARSTEELAHSIAATPEPLSRN